jgi:pimeloyl-ACP methyl ester carboxylesterase
MSAVRVDGLEIQYETAGSRSPAVCLVHGTGGSAGVWRRQLEGLADLARVIALDLPGHGASEGAVPSSIEDGASVVARLLDALGVPRVVIGGHSMGGAIAQQFALDYPARVAGLVLIGTGARLRVLPRLLDLLDRDYPEGLRLLMGLAVGADAPAHLKDALHRQTAASRPGVVLADLRACDAFDVLDRIGTVRVPTLALCGEEDQLTPAKYTRVFGERIAGASTVIVPGAGHYVQMEKPEETTEAIRRFLQKLPRD